MEYTVVQADTTKDRQEIIDFWKTNFPRWPEKKYLWLYQNNVYGKAICWVVRHNKDNKIVGSIALFPKRIVINGEPHTAGLAGDLGVDKNHRKHGLASLLRKELLKYLHDGNCDLLYGTPNDTSVRITLRAGYKAVARPIRFAKYLTSFNFLKRKLKINLLAKIFSKPLDMILSLLSPEKKILRKSDYRYEIKDDFDKEFDELWKTCGKENTVLGERTSHFLNWRFKDCVYDKYRVFTLYEKDKSSLCGYIVFGTKGQEIIVEDILTKDFDKSFDDLMALFIDYAREKDFEIVSVYFVGKKALSGSLKKFRFFSFPEERTLIVYSKEDFEHHSFLQNSDHWLFFQADSDV